MNPLSSSAKSLMNPFLAPHLPLFETIRVERYAFSTLRQQIDDQRNNYKKYEDTLQTAENYTFSSVFDTLNVLEHPCLLYTSPSPRDLSTSRMPSSA